jgi:hypothetical protein
MFLSACFIINENARIKEIRMKKMTFIIRALPGTTESSNLLVMIESDDPFTSYKYPMSLGDYCLLPVSF